MSVLLPATRKLLEGARAHEPYFSNMIAAELHEAAHTRGDLTLLPFALGGWIVFDREAPNGRGKLAGPFPLVKAHEELERLAAKRAPK